MKPKMVARMGLLFLVGWLAVPAALIAADEQPRITSIQIEHNSVTVVASVPAGIRKVTLQSRTRVSGSAWVPRAVERLDGKGGDLTFTLPISSQIEILRILADSSEPLPASFYAGTNAFPGSAPTSSPVFMTPGAGDVAGIPPADQTRDVVESDIWKVDGNTIYFFNTYRGLQVIDISNSAAPVIKGQYSLPAAGEQMYLIEKEGKKFAVLLAQDSCGWWGDSSSSRVVVLDVTTGDPQLVNSAGVEGYISESRMVGSALYVTSQSYHKKETDAGLTWEWGTVAQSFDLSDPTTPVTKDSLWFTGYGNTIAASEDYLFVVTAEPSNWMQSIVNVVDISSPTGEMKLRRAITPNGRVSDKFKINQNGNILTIVSTGWDEKRAAITVLQTYSIENPDVPEHLAELVLTKGEQAYATSFDGNRVYIVTFLRIDPLWVVDLSDPTHPEIKGELQIPGWSTYIQPLGDRLLAMGVDPTNGWRSTVALFDVADAAKPTLVNRVELGDGYSSWSEANSDEKAFNAIEEAGLILVPINSYDTNGYKTQIQLLDFDKNSLTKRGVIDHKFQARRATLENNSIFSISGQELLSVDPTDRDHPVLKAKLDLAWSVDRVFVSGDFLVQIDNGQFWWNGSPSPRVLISTKDEPAKVLGSQELPLVHPVAGAALKNNKLYIAQTRPYWTLGAKDDPATHGDPTNRFFVTTVDLSSLPAVQVVGVQEFADDLGSYGSLTALWPKDDLLVWSTGSGGYFPWRWGAPIDVAVAGVAADAAMMPIWWWGGSFGRFFAMSVSDPNKPAFKSYVDLADTNGWWSYSKSFAVDGGLVYVSHQNNEFLPDIVLPGSTPAQPTVVIDPATGEKVTNTPPVGIWVSKYYLDVVDFTDAENPVIRKPVNIPGQLAGVSDAGAMLYCQSFHYNADYTTDYTDWIDAAAYDGVSAFLVDSLHLPPVWPHPYAINGRNVFLGVPAGTNTPPAVQLWTLSDAGKFTLGNQVELAANDLRVLNDALVISMNGSTVLYPATLGIPKPLGSVMTGGCMYGSLENATGDLQNGVFIPWNQYGVLRLVPSAR